jgi:hypothetical protein
LAAAKASADAKSIGGATAKLFDSISNRRPYDSYCRPVRESKNKDNSRRAFHPITDIRPAHRPLHEIRAEAESAVDAIRRKLDPGFLERERSSAIGYETPKYGPPGLSPPIKGIMKSHRSERYFQNCESCCATNKCSIVIIVIVAHLMKHLLAHSISDDGKWKDGLPEGNGRYMSADGAIFSGQFRKGQPHGNGSFRPSSFKATGPSANDDEAFYYEGEYRSGLPHGKGKCCYRGGITYDGDWKAGRRDGHGTITYPNNSHYTGGFRRGQMHGHGTFTSGTAMAGTIYSGECHGGYVSGEGCLTLPSGITITKHWTSKGRMSGRMTVVEAIEHMMNG